MPSQTAERLRLHLEAQYGIDVTAMTDLDVGVWRVGRADGRTGSPRWFPARRSAEAVAGDATILRYVATREFRLSGARPRSRSRPWTAGPCW